MKYFINNLRKEVFVSIVYAIVGIYFLQSCAVNQKTELDNSVRQKISINNGWKFFKYDSMSEADNLIYDVRPEVEEYKDGKPADSEPTDAEKIESSQKVLKPWIMPTGNEFINNPNNRYERREGNPGNDFPFVQVDFDDSKWESVNLPHDWAIKGPFFEGDNPEVGGGMGRLPSPGIAWYRKKLDIPEADSGKCIFLDVDGAMSYAMVWLNGNLVGGWPYGYTSWRVDLTSYLVPGGENQLAIRLDNPNNSSRWYPGGGLYRNVWLTKVDPVHVAHWGTYVTTENVSDESADVNIAVTVDNMSDNKEDVKIITKVYALNDDGSIGESSAIDLDPQTVEIPAGQKVTKDNGVTIDNPKLWGPPPEQTPNMYTAVTSLYKDDELIDQYETKFGIRSLTFDPDSGLIINGELVKIKGVNQHHDLGALGAAFNMRAAERQLEILREMGCNAIRMSHNPPAPELLELTDRMGFLVMDEAFDMWERKKNPLDFHLIFPEWYEQDLRAMVRRDRNNPSVIMWSYGNEVGVN